MGLALALGGLLLVLAGGWGPVSGEAPRAMDTVVVAAHHLPLGAVIAAADVRQVPVPAGSVLRGLVRSVQDVVGRRLVRAMGAGAPVSEALLDVAQGIPAPGFRLVRLVVDAAAVPAGLSLGDSVDVVAAVPSGEAEDRGGRLVTVATGTVQGLMPSTAEEGRSGAPNQVALTLEADVSGAARLLWAQAFAKALDVVARPDRSTDAAPLPDVSGADVSRESRP